MEWGQESSAQLKTKQNTHRNTNPPPNTKTRNQNLNQVTGPSLCIHLHMQTYTQSARYLVLQILQTQLANRRSQPLSFSEDLLQAWKPAALLAVQQSEDVSNPTVLSHPLSSLMDTTPTKTCPSSFENLFSWSASRTKREVVVMAPQCSLPCVQRDKQEKTPPFSPCFE